MGVGLNLDMFTASAERVDKSRQSTARYLQEDERQRYIDHRFSRAVVRRVTGLQPPLLDTFMHQYRPTYEMLQSSPTDWELFEDIQFWAKSFRENWKEEHPDWGDSTALHLPPRDTVPPPPDPEDSTASHRY